MTAPGIQARLGGGDLWLVVNIGCIECGVSSAIVGLYSDKTTAETVADTLDRQMDWREGGQNRYEVFALPSTLNAAAPEYIDAVKALQDGRDG